MAGRSNRLNLALALLLVAGVRHYGWVQLDPELRGVASKGLGGIEVLALLALVWRLIPSARVRCVLAFWAVHEVMVAGCSAWWLVKPWEVPAGQPMCSYGLGLDLGAVGLVAFLIVAIFIINKKEQ